MIGTLDGRNVLNNHGCLGTFPNLRDHLTEYPNINNRSVQGICDGVPVVGGAATDKAVQGSYGGFRSARMLDEFACRGLSRSGYLPRSRQARTAREILHSLKLKSSGISAQPPRGGSGRDEPTISVTDREGSCL